MKSKTKKQVEILQFIETFVSEKGISPSFREISAKFNFKSLGSVYRHIHNLQKKGLLKLEKGKRRSLSLTEKETAQTNLEYSIPLIGVLRGGMPLELSQEIKLLPVLRSLVREKESTYLLRIKGDTLKEEYILDGDLLLIEARTSVFNGQMALIIVNGHDPLIKRIYLDPPYVRLESSNPEVQPLILRENHIQIQGIILNLQREY